MRVRERERERERRTDRDSTENIVCIVAEKSSQVKNLRLQAKKYFPGVFQRTVACS